MRCPEHPEVEVETAEACPACAARARRETAEGSVVFVVAAAYLATLAVCIVAFRARPFVGGLAAVVAIATGRLLQVVLVSRGEGRDAARTPPPAGSAEGPSVNAP